MNGPAILHETPARLRLRFPPLAEPGFKPAWLESWMETQPGVEDVRINRNAACLVVTFDPKRTGRAAVLDRLEAFRVDQAPAAGRSASVMGETAPMVTSAATLAMAPLLQPRARRLLTLANVAPILADGAGTLLREGIKMEVLDAAAVGLSALRGEVYTANLTAFLLALGEFLEHQTQRRSDRLLRRLLRPEPAAAWVERDGELLQVSGDAVGVGEIVVVGVGETVPVDGRVVDGVALVNQAAVTGEDVPVRREQRHRVVAGSIVEEGRIRIEAQRVGSDTTTARVASFIQASLENRSDTCALKLGTPMAFKTGMVRAAGHGVLMRGGAAIEHLSEVDTVVFDKTGTLTHSELVVTDVVVMDSRHLTEDALLALVASVEEHASHPLAQAVVDAARERDLQHITHGEVDYLVAHGLSTDVEGTRVIIGSRHFLEEHHAVSFNRHEAVIERLQDEGKTLLYVGAAARGQITPAPIGVVALRDTLRADAGYALKRLRALGVGQIVMITGDRRAKAEALAKEVGIDVVHAEVAPEDKAAIIQRLQADGRKVAFVGDGINDGPALSVANVGIAMPRGADIARATADIVLMDDRLTAVADAREIAARTMALIRSNFNIAVGVNTAVLAGAVLGWLSPVMSAVLHNGTTIGVLLRALAGAGVASQANDERRAAPQRAYH